MEVRHAILELQYSLEHVASEQDLLQAVSGGLRGLRESYPSNKSAFTSDDFAFLKNLNGILGHLQGFVELNEELPDGASLEERCSRHHPMVIRKGARDYFWGCETAELTPAQMGQFSS